MRPCRDRIFGIGANVREFIPNRKAGRRQAPSWGDDPVAIIRQHINTPPVAPTWHNSECPRPLEAPFVRSV